MSFLREAVEEKRKYYIQLLTTKGIFQKDDKSLELLTLTELQTAYKKYK